MKTALVVALAIFAAACSGPATSVEPSPEPASEAPEEPEAVTSEAAYTPITFEGQTATDSEREACLEVGGEIVPSGKLQWENCVQTFADGGKACASESDCIGECRYEGDEVEPGTDVAGTCQSTDARFGCRTVVHDGKILHTLCVD